MDSHNVANPTSPTVERKGEESPAATPAPAAKPKLQPPQAAPAIDSSQLLVFYDIETTIPQRKGEKQELIEFAAIAVRHGGLVETEVYSTLVYSDKTSPRSIACNGITADMLVGAPPFLDVASRIFDMLDGRVWVGHNIINFDNKHMQRYFCEQGLKPPTPAAVIDTLPWTRRVFQGRVRNFKMDTLSQYFGLGTEKHRALADCRTTLEVMKCITLTLALEQQLTVPLTSAATPSSRAASSSPSTTTPQRRNAKGVPTSNRSTRESCDPAHTATRADNDRTPVTATAVARSPDMTSPWASAASAAAASDEAGGDSSDVLSAALQGLQLDSDDSKQQAQQRQLQRSFGTPQTPHTPLHGRSTHLSPSHTVPTDAMVTSHDALIHLIDQALPEVPTDTGTELGMVYQGGRVPGAVRHIIPVAWTNKPQVFSAVLFDSMGRRAGGDALSFAVRKVASMWHWPRNVPVDEATGAPPPPPGTGGAPESVPGAATAGSNLSQD